MKAVQISEFEEKQEKKKKKSEWDTVAGGNISHDVDEACGPTGG
jgi:hypothetical protein